MLKEPLSSLSGDDEDASCNGSACIGRLCGNEVPDVLSCRVALAHV